MDSLVFVLQTRITLAIALTPVAPAPTAIMDHQTPPPSFWTDKRARWVARAQAFNVATATSAVAALNEHIRSAAGSLSHEKVALTQGSDGLFEWTPSSLSLLRQMGEDVSILDDIGRTAASSSPVKGTYLSPPPPSPPPGSDIVDTRSATFGGVFVLPARVSGHGGHCHSGRTWWRRRVRYIAAPQQAFVRRAALGGG